MAAPLVAGLTRMLSFQDIKKETKKIAKSKVSPKTESENKKISKKSGLLSSKEDKVESKISKTNSGDGEEYSTFTGTSRKLSIKSASNSLSQIEQLKINVTNIHKFLVKSNNQYLRLQSTNKKILVREESKKRLQRKEGKLKKKTSPIEKSAGIMIGSIPGQSIFDKIFEFATLILAGIIVNALPEIIKKVKEIIDNIVNFLTPIQSGFNLIKAFFTDEIDQVKYDADKKRVDDALEKINGEGGLIDQIAEKTGPLEGLIKKLKPAIEGLRIGVGGKNMVLAKKGGKEGVLNKETGEFTERQFTAGERKMYDDSVGGQISEGSSSGSPIKVTNLTYGLVNPTPNTDILKNKGGYAADTGLDIIGKVGDPIVSPVDGILEYAERGHTAQMGQDSDPTKPGIQDQLSFRIRLRKPFTFEGKKVNFVYGTHLATLDSKVANKSGIPIKAGQRLGTMGVANNVPHLHIGFVEDRAQTGFLNFKEVRRLLSGQSSNKEKKGAAGLMKGVKKDERNKQISLINQSMDDEDSMTIAIQQVNTIQTAYVPMPIPIRSKSIGSTPSTLSPLWSA